MEKLEKVQRTATKIIHGYKDLSYEERLKGCGLTTLDKRRSRRDLIEAYKIVTGKEAMWWERSFELAPIKITRGGTGTNYLRKGILGQKLFSARVVDLWNELGDGNVHRRRLWGEPGRIPQKIGKRPCIYQFLPHFPPKINIRFPNIFNKPVPVVMSQWIVSTASVIHPTYLTFI